MGISERLNFNEIQRNRGIFREDEHEALLAECLAKSKDQDLPHELQEWVSFYETY